MSNRADISGSHPTGQAPAGLDASRIDPGRTTEIVVAFHDLVIACVKWAGASDECLVHYPVEEMERAFKLLDPIFGDPDEPFVPFLETLNGNEA
jgi:hypothetical protein